MRPVVLLIAVAMAFWLLVAIPARALGGGDSAVIFSGTALLLCLIPTIGTLAWGAKSLRERPDQQITMILGGTGLRMFFVLCGGLLISKCIPYYEEQTSFW